jgi:hypothetical protein
MVKPEIVRGLSLSKIWRSSLVRGAYCVALGVADDYRDRDGVYIYFYFGVAILGSRLAWLLRGQADAAVHGQAGCGDWREAGRVGLCGDTPILLLGEIQED